MQSQQAEQLLLQQLATVYEPAEAAAIANLVMEDVTGRNRMQRRLAKTETLTAEQEARLQQLIPQLLQHRPVQYVLGKAWFFGMELQVNESVLIPRPETEEMVQWILEEKTVRQHARILDIGTGSGCIPIAIKKNWPSAMVWGMDISEDALAMAAANGVGQRVEIQWVQADILDPQQWPAQAFDVIISNPPYIPQQESSRLDKHVTDWEPHLALFVPDNDPLLFYRRIADFARQQLSPGGSLYFECHQDYAAPTSHMLQEKGFAVELRKDLFGNDRMMRCHFP
jgi:release factor glutamine methyltransferase